jgi:hypothetical protein
VGLLFACVSGTATWGAPGPETLSRTLIVTRDGREIGAETISIEHQAERLIVSLAIHLQVKMLGVTVYRFDQDSTEAWNAGTFEELSSRTSDNGAQHRVQVSRQASALQMQADKKSVSLDQGSVPGSQWFEPRFQSATLIHNVDGHLLHVTVRKLGTEQIQAGGAWIEARHYRFSGDLSDDFWFGPDGLLVQRRLTAPDHSVVQFTIAPKLAVADSGAGNRSPAQ